MLDSYTVVRGYYVQIDEGLNQWLENFDCP